MLSDKQIRKILKKYRKGLCSTAEVKAIEDWYQHLYNSSDWQFKSDEELLTGANIKDKLSLHLEKNKSVGKVIKFKKWSAVAAAIVIIAGASVFLSHSIHLKKHAPELVAKNSQNDIAPGGSKAILTLSNGKTIILDSAHQGQLANQGGIQIIKWNNGSIEYKMPKQNDTQAIAYNTLSTPASGMYQLLLPDGTRVWLNSASSIHYPTNFKGTNRTVEITGEAYFEVVHNAKMPFQVKVGNTIIRDLGTHFNINAYSNEPTLKITLLQGAVQVEEPRSNTKQLMRPNEQVSIDKQGVLTLNEHADLDKAIAWKEGVFDFNGENLATVMREIARWYNVDVKYAADIPHIQFNGEIHRDVNLSQVLEMLSYFQIHFKIAGDTDKKTILITP